MERDDELRMLPAVDDGNYTTRVDPEALAQVEKTAEYMLLRELLEAALMQTPWIRGFRPETKVAVLVALAMHAAVAGSLSRREILGLCEKNLDKAFKEAEDWNNDVDGIRTKLQAEFKARSEARRQVQEAVMVVTDATDLDLESDDVPSRSTTLFGQAKKKLFH